MKTPTRLLLSLAVLAGSRCLPMRSSLRLNPGRILP